MKEFQFLNCRMHSVSMAQTLEVIKQRIQKKIFTQHVVVNVAKLVHMQKDVQLKESVEACDIINIDGMGVVLGARFLGNDVPERVAGVDLFYNLIGMSEQEGFPVFLLGATSDVVEETTRRLQAQHPKLNLAGFHHGYFWDDEEAVVNQIKQKLAHFLFIKTSLQLKKSFPCLGNCLSYVDWCGSSKTDATRNRFHGIQYVENIFIYGRLDFLEIFYI